MGIACRFRAAVSDFTLEVDLDIVVSVLRVAILVLPVVHDSPLSRGGRGEH